MYAYTIYYIQLYKKKKYIIKIISLKYVCVCIVHLYEIQQENTKKNPKTHSCRNQKKKFFLFPF